MEILVEYLKVFFVSMVPVLELRFAIPLGHLDGGLPLWSTLLVAVAGNMVPVPFILLFIKEIFRFLRKRSEKMERLVSWLEDRAAKKGKALYRSEVFGLFVLVAIPLPGTGAWTGALVAALFNLRRRVAIPVIGLGVLAAGIIMTAASYGLGAIFG